MAANWQITPSAERLELEDGRAEVVFVVSNPGPVDEGATVDVVGSEQTDASWFSVAEPRQTVPHGGSRAFAAVVKPPDDAPSGRHWLAGRVYSADGAPEETSVTSNRVAFEVAESEPPPWWRRWLWVLIAGAVLVVAVVVVLLIVLLGGDEPVEPAGVKRGEFTLQLGQFIDVDEARLDTQGLESHDIAYQMRSETEAVFRANHGAVIANFAPEGTVAVVIDECRRTTDVTRELGANIVINGVGSFCVRTAQGRVALIEVISRPEFALSVTITSHPPEGTR